MEFLKKLFGGSSTSGTSGGDRNGMYFYVKPRGCDEVVRVRIDMNNDLSLADSGNDYFVIKTVRGTSYKCTRSAELHLQFGGDRRLRNSEVSGGDLVKKEDYDAWLASGQAS